MKKAGILGTGMVGSTIGSKLIQLGYDVKMGSRTAGNPKALEWVNANGEKASQGNFANAAAFGEIIFNCTKGEHSLNAIGSAGTNNLKGKIVVDVSNPLDFSNGMPPSLIPGLTNTHSLGEAVQSLLPETRVVKTLNIVNCEVMVNAVKSGGDATMLIAGDDEGSKAEVRKILNQFGWKDIMDLGGIIHSRGMEMMLPIWLSLYNATKNGYLAFKIIR